MPKRPCWVEISIDSFANNYRTLVDICAAPAGGPLAPVELLAIVKADAYGHGLAKCAAAAVKAGARWLGVTSVEEGAAARQICVEAGYAEIGILVIGGPFPGQGATVIDQRLVPVVWEKWQLDEIEVAAGHAPGSVPVHLELDTGMSRQGAGLAELDAILERFGPHSQLRLDGLMTHLYAADESDGAVTRDQFSILERMVRRIADSGLQPEWLHVGNSAAVLAGDGLRQLQSLCSQFGLRAMARPGLALYGLAPEFTPDEPLPVRELRGRLRRVLEWKTQVVSVRSVEPGAVIGYNGTFVATEPMRVALLAAGYADGLRRALSNRGSVLVRGCRAPIVGRISMDQTVVDVTEIPEVVPGEEVVLIGRQGAESITAEDHARWAGTIPWEIFTGIAARVERHEVNPSGQGSGKAEGHQVRHW